MLDSMSRDRVVRAGLQDLTHPRSTLNMWCIGDADIHGTHLSMMGRGMMLGVIIAKIFRARTPIDYKVSLADTVANPVETYVHCFGVFFNSVVCKTGRYRIIGLHWRGWLRMTKFLEGDADGYSLLAVIEKGFDFCFSSGGHDIADIVAYRMDRIIERRLGTRRFWGLIGAFLKKK